MTNLKLKKIKKIKKITKLTTIGLGVVSTVTISVSLLSLSLYWNTYYTATENAKSTGEGLVAYSIDNNMSSGKLSNGSLWAAGLGQGYSKGCNPSELSDGDNSFIESGRSLQTFTKKENNGSFDYELIKEPAKILPEIQTSQDNNKPIHNQQVSEQTNFSLNNDTNGDGFENVFDLVGVAVIPEFKIESNKGPEFEKVYKEHEFTYEEAMIWNEFMYDGLDVNVYASTEAYYELNIPAISIAFASTILVGVGLFSLLGITFFETKKNKIDLDESKEVSS